MGELFQQKLTLPWLKHIGMNIPIPLTIADGIFARNFKICSIHSSLDYNLLEKR
jgi:hypothetical protein